MLCRQGTMAFHDTTVQFPSCNTSLIYYSRIYETIDSGHPPPPKKKNPKTNKQTNKNNTTPTDKYAV